MHEHRWSAPPARPPSRPSPLSSGRTGTCMSVPIYTQWGGRNGRYKSFPRGVSRCQDPFDHQPVQYPTELEYEVWLRVRFDADTLTISHRRECVTCKNGSLKLASTATVISTTRFGGAIYHQLLGSSARSCNTDVLEQIARTKAASVRYIHADHLRQTEPLFWRLELLRQAATTHEFDGGHLDGAILGAVGSGVARRFDLHKVMPSDDAQLLDARLATLHCFGLLRLQFDQDDYGLFLPGNKT